MLELFTLIQTRLGDLREERGATAVEYGLIIALIAGAIIVVVGLLGADIKGAFDGVENGINGSQG